MVDHFADSVEAACSRARVVAFVVSSAGKCPVTVRVDDTFRSAASVGVSKVFWETRALTARASHRSICIGTTRVRVARVSWWRWSCGWRVTCREGITNEAWVAPADWAVPGHRALGVHPADPRTGVHAFISHTCLVSWAIWIDGAFRLAFNVRVALQARQTGAGGSALPVAAHGVDAAWRRSAWVNGAWCGSWRPPALAEGVSNIALVTDADGNVVPHTAVGVDPTKARTRILALAPDACLI